jgi:hypothetical protein
MPEPFYKICGPIFEAAKAKLESFGPRADYMAGAIFAADDLCYAAYAAPGSIPEFVYSEDGSPAVFRDIKAAEAKAREELFNMLNANLRAEISN